MKLLEKLRAQPAWQSEDPSVRLDAVRRLPDDDEADDVLLDRARCDADPRVRRAAIERMTDLSGLVSLLQAPDVDTDTRSAAVEGVREVVVETTDVKAVGDALNALTDERNLGAIARSSEAESVGFAALERVVSDKVLSAVARKARHMVVALEAVRRLNDRLELLAVAIKADDKATALAAYERLTDDDLVDAATLNEIVRRAKHKGVARRARETLEAQVGRETPSSVVAADRQDAAQALCAVVEQLATSVNALGDGRRALDATVEAWSKVEGPIDANVAERFAFGRRAVEDRLLAIDASIAKVQRVADQRLNAASVRGTLCLRVEQLDGAEALEMLPGLRAEWEALEVPVDLDTKTAASLAGLATRFEAAVTNCEERHANFNASQTQVHALELLVSELEQLIAAGVQDAIRKGWSALDKQWRHAIADLGDLDTHSAALTALRERKLEVDQRRELIEAEARSTRQKTALQQLVRLQKLAQDVEFAVKNEKLQLGDAERHLRQVRQTLEALPSLPTRRDREAIIRRLRAATTSLLGRVRELRDFADWQGWANLGIQEDLCRQMEALASPPDDSMSLTDAEVAKKFRELMTRWREVANVPREKGQVLWQRFKIAHDVVYPRCETFFAVKREKDRERRLALVGEAERLMESTDWIKTASRLTALQLEWKALGSAPHKNQRELWARFRTACSTFFTRRKADLAERKREWNTNLKQKEALCERIEALHDVDAVSEAIKEAKKLQAEWKKVGPVRRNKSDAIWERFREACDSVFDRAKDVERKASADRIAAREALCAELESLLSGPPAEGLAYRIRMIQERWRQSPDVPTDIRRKLSARFGKMVSRLVETHPEEFRGTDLDPARKLKQLQTLCERAETLVPTEVLDETGVSPAEILAKKWRDQLASNTMGGGVDEEALRRATADEVKRLQAERRRLGQLAGMEASTLHARFQRACDQVFQKNRSSASAF